eukprot:CAMPEP_0118713078 /NCGR_PEP_ID=MMETSP0800-20121206/25261_1 /TAXON_ID=210618 ORGANISM="Striatella unipunctata, Strain CCMP2910" /NCGR_SAMPLE_ID=MMETSP0800 /ASSEMBLY_ACC=CAM_ASM_000638 /LENGTH=199 /DNA_ID=CAMNT_0006618379 /DNA_START=1 /DNA_END=600 /DNA_ORIENTATION=-
MPPTENRRGFVGHPPSYGFSHCSTVSHAFALCWKKGGPPFAIYQQRRCWDMVRSQQWAYAHTHAIAVLPGGEIEELHVNIRADHANQYTQIFHRDTGKKISSTSRRPQQISSSQQADQQDPAVTEKVRELAEIFYGVRVPSSEDQIWRRPETASSVAAVVAGQPFVSLTMMHATRALTSPCTGPVCLVSKLGEFVKYDG